MPESRSSWPTPQNLRDTGLATGVAAADKIERLEAEIDGLRLALGRIVNISNNALRLEG